MPTASIQKERHFIYYLALVSLIVAIAGSFFNWLIARNYNHEIVAQRTVGRRLTVDTFSLLCTNIYGNVYTSTEASLKTATVAHYHALLPSLSVQDIANLVAESRVSLAAQAKKFDPKQCSKLPIRQLLGTPTTTTSTNKNS